MTELKTLEDFKQYMLKAYKHSNFFDSQYQIEELKKKFSEKELISFIKKELKIVKNNIRLCNKETEAIRLKYQPQNDYIWQEALNYVTHKYSLNEWVFFHDSGIKIGQIKSFTKKGYKIFIGRKLGIMPEIKFEDIICHASNIKKIAEVIQDEKNT